MSTHRTAATAVEILTSGEQLDRLRGEWDRLLDDSASDGIFLSWDWVRAWCRHFAADRGLCVITVREGGDLIGVAPLAHRWERPLPLLRLPAIQFLGSGSVGSDYLDLIVRRGCETRAVDLLTDRIGSLGLPIRLVHLLEGACTDRLVAGMEQRGWACSAAPVNVCPYIDLSDRTWPAYLAGLGPEHRYNFERRLRNLGKRQTFAYERVDSERRRQVVFPLLVALHHLRWSRRGGSDALNEKRLVAFHDEVSREALRRGRLRLFMLWVDGHPAAGLYGFMHNGVFSFYQSGFDPRFSRQSVGLVAMGLTIRSAIEEGAREFDLLHGDEPYKSHWASRRRSLREIRMLPPDLRGWLLRGAWSLRRAAGAARRLAPAARRILSTGNPLRQGERHAS